MADNSMEDLVLAHAVREDTRAAAQAMAAQQAGGRVALVDLVESYSVLMRELPLGTRSLVERTLQRPLEAACVAMGEPFSAGI